VPVEEEDKPLYRAVIDSDHSIRGLVEHINFFRGLGSFAGRDLEITIRVKKAP